MQMNSSALEFHRGKPHVLTCELKTSRLKKPTRHFNYGTIISALVPRYFCNSFVTFLLLPIGIRNNQGSATTLKDFQANIHPTSLGENYFESVKSPI